MPMFADLIDPNAHFQPRRVLGAGLFDQLLAAQRVFPTEATFASDAEAKRYVAPLTREQAKAEREMYRAHFGMADREIDRIQAVSAGRFAGHVVTQTPGDLAEAEAIVARRAIPGERLLGGPSARFIPLDDAAHKSRMN